MISLLQVFIAPLAHLQLCKVAINKWALCVDAHLCACSNTEIQQLLKSARKKAKDAANKGWYQSDFSQLVSQ